MFGRKVELPPGAPRRIHRKDVERLTKLAEMFATDIGRECLREFRERCAVGMRVSPSDATAHTYRQGMMDPYTRLIEDIKVGIALDSGSSEIRVTDPMKEDVYDDPFDRKPNG